MKTFKAFLLEESEHETRLRLLGEDIGALLKRDCATFLEKTGGVFLYRGIKAPEKHKEIFAGSNVLDIKTRKDRVAAHSASWVHEALGSFFTETFGVNFRTEAAFCSKNKKQAAFYGPSYIIFPKGEFNYACSPIVSDAINFEGSLLRGGFIGIEVDDAETSKKFFAYARDIVIEKAKPSKGLTELLYTVNTFSQFTRKIDSRNPDTRVDPAISDELYVLSRDRQLSKDILTQFLKKHGKELYLFNKGLAEIPSSHEIMLDCESYYAVPTSLEPFIKQWISGA